MLHKVPDELESSHMDVGNASNALLPYDRAHMLRDELLSQAPEKVDCIWS